jgi:hypothetical protein
LLELMLLSTMVAAVVLVVSASAGYRRIAASECGSLWLVTCTTA